MVLAIQMVLGGPHGPVVLGGSLVVHAIRWFLTDICGQAVLDGRCPGQAVLGSPHGPVDPLWACGHVLLASLTM